MADNYVHPQHCYRFDEDQRFDQDYPGSTGIREQLGIVVAWEGLQYKSTVYSPVSGYATIPPLRCRTAGDGSQLKIVADYDDHLHGMEPVIVTVAEVPSIGDFVKYKAVCNDEGKWIAVDMEFVGRLVEVTSGLGRAQLQLRVRAVVNRVDIFGDNRIWMWNDRIGRISCPAFEAYPLEPFQVVDCDVAYVGAGDDGDAWGLDSGRAMVHSTEDGERIHADWHDFAATYGIATDVGVPCRVTWVDQTRGGINFKRAVLVTPCDPATGAPQNADITHYIRRFPGHAAACAASSTAVTIAHHPLSQEARASLQAFISNHQNNDAVSFYSNFIVSVAVGRGCGSENDWILVSDAIGTRPAFHQFVTAVARGLHHRSPRLTGSVVIVAYHRGYTSAGTSTMDGVLGTNVNHAKIPVYVTGHPDQFIAAITRLTPFHIVMETSDISLVTKVRKASLRVKQRLGFVAQTTVFIPDGTIDLHLPVISAARFWNTIIVPRSHIVDYIKAELIAQPHAAPIHAAPIALPVFSIAQQPPAPLAAQGQGVQQPPADAATQSESSDGSTATSTALEIPESVQQPSADTGTQSPVLSQPPSGVNVKKFVDAYEARSQSSETPIFRTTGLSESSDDSTATSTAMEIPKKSSDNDDADTSDDEKTSARSDDAEHM